MARDALGRFLPGFDPTDEAAFDGRHVLSRAERQKGYRIATQRGRLPSRLQAWLRRKIMRRYRPAMGAGGTSQ